MASFAAPQNWIWHPEWIEKVGAGNSAGAFVHFRKSFTINKLPLNPIRVQISADTRYKLYVNSQFVATGPVKGDEHLWFFDTLDIQPFLRTGVNNISVRVLRFYKATPYATSFPRTESPGLLIQSVDGNDGVGANVQGDETWETALDLSSDLPTDIKEDDFLQVYERVKIGPETVLRWVQATQLQFPSSHGISAPWKLSERLIPFPQYQAGSFKSIHNIRSTETVDDWEAALPRNNSQSSTAGILLPAGTSHHLELEVEHHMTAFLEFRFKRPIFSGSTLKVTYSESYEEPPAQIPYLRCKGDRKDTTKLLLGPEDKYVFGGIEHQSGTAGLRYHESTEQTETFAPFHFRTLRFLTLDIEVAQQSDLIFERVDLMTTNYPLEIIAEFDPSETEHKALYHDLWTTSIRTLTNCMHDCYEDCPFYEQLQYVMDARSSCLFTYCVAGDDRMARQAIIQIHNTYRPSLGLTASRAPSHQFQIIPNFSLFWICMVTDHFEYFGDASFVRQFTSVMDGVLATFARRIDDDFGLVRSNRDPAQWDFVDWTDAWRPMGIPPAASRTGFQSYTNMLYAYTLKRAATVLNGISRPALAIEYLARADKIVQALQTHCFDGQFFTDGLSSGANASTDFSQHGQIWAILCGAAVGDMAFNILSKSLKSPRFTKTSIAMSFYALRALSAVGGNLYNDEFHTFWAPWGTQLANGLTTWEEDTVSQRSDCHAWGSSPLFEFMAEVSGLRPREPGWATVNFEPRVTLVPVLDAKVPFTTKLGPGVAHVKWRCETDECRVFLHLKMSSGKAATMPVYITFPDGSVEVRDGSTEINFGVKLFKS